MKPEGLGKAVWSTLLVLCSLLQAQEPPPAAPPPTSAEHLLASPPKDWVARFGYKGPQLWIGEFLPPDEDPVDWRNRFYFESFPHGGSTDPIELLLQEAEHLRGQCSFVQHFNIASGYENGYASSLRLFLCGQLKGTRQGQVDLVKAIQGRDRLFVIRRSRRLDTFGVNEAKVEDMPDWARHFRRITLCDPSVPGHPCPTPPPPAPSAPRTDAATPPPK